MGICPLISVVVKHIFVFLYGNALVLTVWHFTVLFLLSSIRISTILLIEQLIGASVARAHILSFYLLQKLLFLFHSG